MGERANVEDRLRWADQVGEARLRLATVDVGNLERPPGEPSGMQDNEACAIGNEIGLRRGDGGEGERAVARSGYPGFIGEPLSGVRADGPVGDREAP